jgi:hypothetical protein
MLRGFALLLFCLAMPGCAQYQARLQAAQAAQQQAIDDADDAQCRQYNNERHADPDKYLACRQNLTLNRQAASQAQQQASLALMQTGFQMMATPPRPAPQPPPEDHICIAPNNTFYRC